MPTISRLPSAPLMKSNDVEMDGWFCFVYSKMCVLLVFIRNFRTEIDETISQVDRIVLIEIEI